MPTILCIDDQEHGLAIRKLMLETAGYKVLIATEGVAGLTLIEQNRVDAVLLDYHMEGMDGEAVATVIKRRHPQIPIVMLSAYSLENPGRILRLVDVFVAKGQPTEVLLTALEKATGSKPEKRGLAKMPAEALEQLRKQVQSSKDTPAKDASQMQRRRK